MTPKKGGYTTPSPALDRTTSLRGDWYFTKGSVTGAPLPDPPPLLRGAPTTPPPRASQFSPRPAAATTVCCCLSLPTVCHTCTTLQPHSFTAPQHQHSPLALQPLIKIRILTANTRGVTLVGEGGDGLGLGVGRVSERVTDSVHETVSPCDLEGVQLLLRLRVPEEMSTDVKQSLRQRHRLQLGMAQRWRDCSIVHLIPHGCALTSSVHCHGREALGTYSPPTRGWCLHNVKGLLSVCPKKYSIGGGIIPAHDTLGRR